MTNATVSRRTFLQGTAAATTLAATGSFSFNTWQAHAQEEPSIAPLVSTPSLCNACTSKCGLFVETKDGVLSTVHGNETHPYSKGKLCARGHGFSQMAYSKELLTQPMRRTENGEFEAISWDTAFEEISAKLIALIEESGPESLAAIHDPRPSGKYYIPRFFNALGSANLYTHNAACNSSKVAGLYETIGSSGFSVDFDACKMVVFIGRSYGDGIRPSSALSLANAAEAGTRVVIVDPRLNNSGIFANDWLPVRPGSDLALLMSIAHVLIEDGLYDHDFVASYCHGFDEFAAQAKEYTPEWAADKTDISAETIREIATALAQTAPACAIEAGWRGAFGCAYHNSFDTARAIAAVNALLGSWGQKGGALITPSLKYGDIADSRFASPEVTLGARFGDDKYGIVPSSYGSNIAALEAMIDGSIKALFLYNSNAGKGYAQPKVWSEGFKKLDLFVAIDIQMSESALQADYVLPECTYLERTEDVDFLGGKKQFVALRHQAIERVHPDTKSCDEIICGLAQACGIDQYFDFTVEELAQANCAALGVDWDEITEKGIVEVTSSAFEYGVPAFKTDTGKFQFMSEKTAAAGLNPVIGYVAPLTIPQEDELFLIGGKQSIHSHTMTLNNEALNEISRAYDMERVWMNATDAQERGIKNNDLVEVASSEHVGTVKVRVTERLKPGVLFLPTHYGGTSPYQSKAYNYGISMMEFVPFVGGEPGTGASMAQEVAVTVKKVGA